MVTVVYNQFTNLFLQYATCTLSGKHPHAPTGGYLFTDRWGSRWITTALTFAFNMLQEANLDIAPML